MSRRRLVNWRCLIGHVICFIVWSSRVITVCGVILIVILLILDCYYKDYKDLLYPVRCCLKMDKRVEARSVTTRSGPSVGMQGRSPAVNVINVTRHPDGGIVNVEMKRQEGLNQESNFLPAATGPLPSRRTVPINVYQQPAYMIDQYSNVIPKQLPRKSSPNLLGQPHNVDGRLDWSDQHQRLMIGPQRIPAVQHHAVPHHNMLSEQLRVPQLSGHAVVDQHLLRGQTNDAILLQHAHALPASDIRFMTPSYATASTTIPPVPVRFEGTNGGIFNRPAHVVHDLPASMSVAGQVVADPKSTANVAPQLISRLPGLQYDVIPPRSDGPSEAERKVAVLTQQLENEMRLTSTQGSLLRQQMTDSSSQYRSPPPYYGPHITANVRMATPSNPASSRLTTAVDGDQDLSNKKAGDSGVHQPVSSLSSGLADVEQPQPSSRQGSDLDASAECYGELVLSSA